MKSIPQYQFYKTKYGEELLIDIVTLDGIRQHISKHPMHTLSCFMLNISFYIILSIKHVPL